MNSKLKEVGIKTIILLIIYSIILICINFVFTDKLNNQELKEVTKFYTEMRNVDSNIRSDFYVNNILKVLDRRKVLENLRIDSMNYATSVGNKAFTLLQETGDDKATLKYIQRCDINFEDFVGLSSAEELFVLYRTYFVNFTDSVDALSNFATYMGDIVEPETKYVALVEKNRNIEKVIIIGSFIGILVIWGNYKDILDVIRKRSSKGRE